MSPKKKIKINTDSEAPPSDNEARDDINKNEERSAADNNNTEDVATGDPVKELEAKLDAKEEEAKDNYDRFLRVSAELDNYKKRSARELEDFRKYANQSLLKEMLSVVDNLELAIHSADENQTHESSLKEGLDLTLREMLRVFEKFQVTPIESIGKAFDPTYHEAVMQEETDEFPENTVVTEMQKGYLIHDRLLRPAMVVVAKPKTRPSDT
jgi:molecular chaperone GrpE